MKKYDISIIMTSTVLIICFSLFIFVLQVLFTQEIWSTGCWRPLSTSLHSWLTLTPVCPETQVCFTLTMVISSALFFSVTVVLFLIYFVFLLEFVLLMCQWLVFRNCVSGPVESDPSPECQSRNLHLPGCPAQRWTDHLCIQRGGEESSSVFRTETVFTKN